MGAGVVLRLKAVRQTATPPRHDCAAEAAALAKG